MSPAHPQPAPHVAVVQVDRDCLGCGYNVRGLPIGGRCPECGMPVHVPGKIDDPLSAMPVPVIKAYRGASWLATACVFSIIVIEVGRRLRWNPPVWTVSIQLGLAVTWLIAVWMLTPALEIPQAVKRGFSARGRLRQAARWLAGGWVIAAGVGLFRELAPKVAGAGSLPEVLPAVFMVGLGAGLLGIVMLGVLLQRLSEWACDREAESALNIVVWAIPISTILLFATASVPVVGILLALLWMCSVAALPYGLFSLSRSITWAVHHSREYQDRLRRRAARAEAYESEVSSTLNQMDDAREQRSTRL